MASSAWALVVAVSATILRTLSADSTSATVQNPFEQLPLVVARVPSGVPTSASGTLNGSTVGAAEHLTRLRVAVFIAGESGRYVPPEGKSRQTICASGGIKWQDNAASTQTRFLLEPISRAAAALDVHLLSYDCSQRCACNWTAQLLGMYDGPWLTSVQLVPIGSRARSSAGLLLRRGIDTAIGPPHACDLAESRRAGVEASPRASLEVSHVVITRPDVFWKPALGARSLALLQTSGAIVFPFACQGRAWQRFNCVSDVLVGAALGSLRTLQRKCLGSGACFPGYGEPSSACEPVDMADAVMTAAVAKHGRGIIKSGHGLARCALASGLPVEMLVHTRHVANARQAPNPLYGLRPPAG